MIRQKKNQSSSKTEVPQTLALIFLNDNSHEVERQPDVLRVDNRRAVREAVRARHRRELGPLVHDVAGREVLVGRDDTDGLVGHRVEELEVAVGHELPEVVLELAEPPKLDAACRRPGRRRAGRRRERRRCWMALYVLGGVSCPLDIGPPVASCWRGLCADQ